MHTNNQNHRAILSRIAHRAMIEHGLLPDFSAEALMEVERIKIPDITTYDSVEGFNEIRDLRNLLWASIDNDDSRDLDQLTTAEETADGKAKIFVAIADVASSILDQLRN